MLAASATLLQGWGGCDCTASEMLIRASSTVCNDPGTMMTGCSCCGGGEVGGLVRLPDGSVLVRATHRTRRTTSLATIIVSRTKVPVKSRSSHRLSGCYGPPKPQALNHYKALPNFEFVYHFAQRLGAPSPKEMFGFHKWCVLSTPTPPSTLVISPTSPCTLVIGLSSFIH